MSKAKYVWAWTDEDDTYINKKDSLEEIIEEKIKAPDDINWSWGGNYPVEIDDVEFQYEEDDEENEDE